jgi:hypothetical protein
MTAKKEAAIREVLKLAAKLEDDNAKCLNFAIKMLENPANDAKY